MKKIFLAAVSCILFSTLLVAQSVGINTNVPDASSVLDVKSTTKGLLVPRLTLAQRNAMPALSTGLMIYQTDNAAGFYFYNGTGWVQLSSGGATNYWSLNGSNIFSNNAGNVGIGTNDPGFKFTLQSATSSYGFAHTDSTVTVASFVGGSAGGGWIGTVSNHPFHIFTNGGTPHVTFSPGYFTDFKGTKPWIRLFDNGTESGSIRSNGHDLEVTAFQDEGTSPTPGNLILQTGIYNPPFVNLLAGNVGVGTRTPAEKFVVKTDTKKYGIVHTDGVAILATYIGMPFDGGSNAGWIGTQSDHPLYFYTNNGTYQMVLLQNGNVGIGTKNPTYKLSVNGNIRSKEVVVETGWADYVFDKKYKLKPLDEVEKFIVQNNHLPGIPSAAEIEKNGLQLGDTQKKMMEKIEELTLYIIELKKEIGQIKKMNYENK